MTCSTSAHKRFSRIIPCRVNANIMPRCTKASIIPRGAKVSIIPHGIKASIIPRGAKVSIIPHGIKASIIPRCTKAKRKAIPYKHRLSLVGRGGFEPPKSVTADLQSAPFGRSGIFPCYKRYSAGASGRNRTGNLLITNQLLCLVELH